MKGEFSIMGLCLANVWLKVPFLDARLAGCGAYI